MHTDAGAPRHFVTTDSFSLVLSDTPKSDHVGVPKKFPKKI